MFNLFDNRSYNKFISSLCVSKVRRNETKATLNTSVLSRLINKPDREYIGLKL